MRIAFIGSRGIPAKYGGFETFVEEITTGLNKYENVELIVVCDKYQKDKFSHFDYGGIKLVYSKYSKAENPNLYYWDSMKQVLNDVDIIYSCGVGAAFTCWVPRLKGVKFVTNPDGMGWRRSKWSFSTKIALFLMFGLATRTSEYFLCDSHEIAKAMKEKFKRNKKNDFIEYGAYENIFLENKDRVNDILKRYGLSSGTYHLVVSRLEPENNVHYIIEGYTQTKSIHPLIVVGNLQETEYVKKLQSIGNGKVRFVGGIYDKEVLQAVRAGALTYLHGHSVGGTNPSLLEAMGSKNLCICHDNPFNREVTDNKALYFSDAKDVSRHLNKIESGINNWDEIRNEGLNRIRNYYNWPSIVERYYQYFRKVYEE